MPTLKEFLKRVPDLGELCARPSALVPFLAFYVAEADPEVIIAPRGIGNLFEEARIKPPSNISYAIRRSKDFVQVRGGGYRLSHEASERIADSLLAASAESAKIQPAGAAAIRIGKELDGVAERTRDVFVIYGRDTRLRQELFSFLRAVGLNPLEFEVMVQRTGSASPYTLEAIEEGFRSCRVCVALFSPDENVSLRSELLEPGEVAKTEMQPRPNVFLEAGMALALHPGRTIFVKVGDVRSISDLDGKQYVKLGNTPASRHKFVGRLKLAGAAVSTDGEEDWLTLFDLTPTSAVKGAG